jgi:RNA polymerase sigma-70 factor (ECF subfamily)
VIDMALVYRDEYRVVFGYLRRRLPRLDLAVIEDLTETVFERALRAAPRFEQGRAPVSAWLTRIAHNVLVSALRRPDSRPTAELEAVAAVASELVVDDQVLATLDHAALRAAVERLPTYQRQVITAFYFQDCSYEEAARRLGIPRPTVGSRLRRALLRLRAELDVAEAAA